MNIKPEEISTLNKLLYVISAIALIIVLIDVKFWRP